MIRRLFPRLVLGALLATLASSALGHAADQSYIFLDVYDDRIEVKVLDSYAKTKNLGHHDHGGIIKTTGPSKNMSLPAEHWNRMIVICKGPHLRVILNGEEIQDLMLDKSAVKDRPPVGAIGIQDHGQKLWVRNIRIKELK